MNHTLEIINLLEISPIMSNKDISFDEDSPYREDSLDSIPQILSS